MTPLLLAAEDASENFASFTVPVWIWAAFVALVAVLLIADLLLVHRTAHVISFKEAAIESAVWIAIGLSFTWWCSGGTAARPRASTSRAT
jgi:tellurite resistance protein TerC